MKPEITFFPVGNGDMTLIKLESERTILIDTNIRVPSDKIRDVAEDLRKSLKTDNKGRPYVDVMVLSHPDQDHCRGFEEHFHTGPLENYSDKANPKKIVIREMWSSPLVFRRAKKKTHTLSDDAKAWNCEAKRRVALFRQVGTIGSDGDRIVIMGEDCDGKTDDIMEIVVKAGETVFKICGSIEPNFSALLLAPMKGTDDEEEEVLTKNNSSIIMNYSIGAGTNPTAVRYIDAGDAEVAIWEKLWDRHEKNVSALQYNLLNTPHHCSWHSLSWDSWSAKKVEAKVSDRARKALGQALPGAVIVASSDEIKDDDNDPPCYRAKQEYEEIVAEVKGEFWNTGAYQTPDKQEPLKFEVSVGGMKRVKFAVAAAAALSANSGLGATPLYHGGEAS
ncbi:hypothetical protein FHW58_004382 [Duganella sp. 1224]|uniref:metallohydrolase n=1 Tax=Duganella sp. 1224 TaxID=2587052 RepID=UPI0015CB3B4B|nr:metallohydrolase [Duganella sp. 1224]NYE63154.1 hypothetical protein [Duganella sp. 1224]